MKTSTKTAKEILNAITFLTKEQKSFLGENKISHLPLNIERSKKGFKFISITEFTHIEQISIDRDDYRIWELFDQFDNLKTALNCMTAIAEGRKFNSKFFENQKNITAKNEITATGFTSFLNGLTPEQKKHLKTAIAEWDKANLMLNAKPYMDMYQLNTANKFKTGDYILHFDKQDNTSYYAKIFQTAPGEIIMMTTPYGFIALDEYSTSVEVVPEEKVPANWKKELDKLDADYSEVGDIARDKAFSKLEKATERAEKAEKKAEEQADKKFNAEIEKALKAGYFTAGEGKNKGKYIFEKKALSQTQLRNQFETVENLTTSLNDFLRAQDEATATAHAGFMKAELKTPESIENLLKDANQYNWSAKQKKALNEKIKGAKELIKKELEAKKNQPKQEAEKIEEVKENEKVVVAKTTTRRRQAPKPKDGDQPNEAK